MSGLKVNLISIYSRKRYLLDIFVPWALQSLKDNLGYFLLANRLLDTLFGFPLPCLLDKALGFIVRLGLYVLREIHGI